jgi:hypothetical protein
VVVGGPVRRLRRDILELCERAQLAGDWLREDAVTCPLEATDLQRAWLAGLTERRGCVEHRLTERGRLALLRARSEAGPSLGAATRYLVEERPEQSSWSDDLPDAEMRRRAIERIRRG